MASNKPSFSEWKIGSSSVDPVMLQGKFINARSTLIAAGPASYDKLVEASTGATSVDDFVYPIGFIENFGLTQQKNLQRMFEIGSNRSYFVPGRTMSSCNFGRVLFHGPSLMRVLYSYYPKDKIRTANGPANDDVTIAYAASQDATKCLPNVGNSGIDYPGTQAPVDDCSPVKSASFYMNLASTLFDHPLGLLVYMKDTKDEYYSAFYLEFCHITAHSLNINATSTVIAEGVGIQFDGIQPVDLAPGTSV